MAAEQEELKLTVTLVDNASAGLAKLNDEIKQLGSGAGQQHIDKFKRETTELTTKLKGMTGELGEAFKGLGMLRGGLAAGGAGLALFGFEMQRQIAAMVQFSDKLRSLNQAARQIGVDPGELKNLIEQFEAVGVKSETATASIGAISGKIAELQRAGSQLRLDLMRGAGHDPQAVKNMEDYLNRLTHAKKLNDELNIIREGGEQVYSNARKQGYSEQEAANRRNNFWQLQGYDAQLMALTKAKEMTAEERRIQDERIAQGNKLADITGTIANKWSSIIEELRAPFLQPAIDAAKGYLALIEKIEATVKNVSKQTQEYDEKRQQYLKEHPDAPRSAVERLRGWMGGGGDKENKHLQENTDQLKRLNDAFDQLNGLKQPSSLTTGGIGGGGGGIIPTAFHSPGGGAPMFGGGGGQWGGGGQVPRSLGGGRPHGSDVGAGSGAGAGATPAGPPTGGGGAGLGIASGVPGSSGDISKGGSAFLASQRAGFAEEFNRDPNLKLRADAITSLENEGAGPAVLESAMNRGTMSGRSMASILQGGPKSFYGPARHPGMVEARMAQIARNAKWHARLDALTDRALGGSNVTLGHTDQGSAGDPNYSKGGVGVNINRERFNDWGGFKGTEYSRRWREQQQAQVAAADRRQLDETVAASTKVEGTGKLSVDVNAPKGTNVSAEGGGLFKKVEMNRQTQMSPARRGPEGGYATESLL